MVICFIEQGVGGKWRLGSLDPAGAASLLFAAGLGLQKRQEDRTIALVTSWPHTLLFWEEGVEFLIFCSDRGYKHTHL